MLFHTGNNITIGKRPARYIIGRIWMEGVLVGGWESWDKVKEELKEELKEVEVEACTESAYAGRTLRRKKIIMMVE